MLHLLLFSELSVLGPRVIQAYDRNSTPPLQNASFPQFGTGPQEPLTIEDLLPPVPSKSLPKSITSMNGIDSSLDAAAEPSPLLSSTSSSVSAAGLQSRARQILMKYKRKSFTEAGQTEPSESLSSQSQISPPSPSGGRTGTPPRDRPGPYDQPAHISRRRSGRMDIIERHAHGLRDSLRSSVSEDLI